jgi:hypothetical protein
VGLEQPARPAADLRAERQRQRGLLGEHERRGDAHRGQRSGHLARDERPADDPHTVHAVHVDAQRVGVAQRAQVVDALEVGPVDRQAAHVGPGRHEGVPVGDGLLGRQRRLARGGVELHDRGPGQHLDVVADGRNVASRSMRPSSRSLEIGGRW